MKQLCLVFSVVLVAFTGMAADDSAASAKKDPVGPTRQTRLELPKNALSKVDRYYEFEGVTQSEAEALFGSAEAAIYEADSKRVRMISFDHLQMARKVLSKLNVVQRGASAGVSSLEKKVVKTGNISLGTFLAGLPKPDGAKAGAIRGHYLVKVPAVGAPLPADVEKPRRIEPKKINSSYAYIYQDFEGDVWNDWSRWDNTGGQYQWGVSSCDAYSGSNSGNASRGGSLGASLGCNDAYPKDLWMGMYFEACEAISPSWEVILEMKIQASIEDGDRFGIYAEDSSEQLWGYTYYGNWPGWYTLYFNVRQWFGLGDLGENACNSFHMTLQSDSSSNTGWWGAMVDDVYLHYGESVGAHQCSITADPSVGAAPLSVQFSAADDLSSPSYYWWFSDGNSFSETQNPAHTFNSPGSYWVNLQTHDSQGNVCTTAKEIVVNDESCTYSISPTSKSFDHQGGTGSVSVSASPSNCAWSASSDQFWITITGGSSGTGNGTVQYSVAANTSASSRSGHLTIAGKTFSISQDGTPSCSYSISPVSRDFGSNGGTGTINVSTQSGCTWNASESLSWVSITSGGSGSGSGTVHYSVAANGGTNSRNGTIQVAGKTHTVNQDGGGSTVTDTYGVAGIAHANGAGGSVWRSTLAVTNTSGGTADLTMIYRYSGSSITRSHTLQNGDIVEWVDVADSLFGVGGTSAGSVEVRSNRPVVVTARTYNEGADGTFGQFLPGVADGGKLEYGDRGILPQVKKTSAFRTNIGFVNLGSSSVSVRTMLYSSTGSQLGNTVTTSIPANQWKQENDIFQKAAVSYCEVGYATIEVTTSGGKVWAYASVVDNGTGDPTTIPVFLE